MSIAKALLTTGIASGCHVSQNHRLSRWLGKALKGHNADKAPEGAPKGLPTAFLFPATPKGASFMPSCSRYP